MLLFDGTSFLGLSVVNNSLPFLLVQSDKKCLQTAFSLDKIIATEYNKDVY